MIENNEKVAKEIDLKSEKSGLVKDFEGKKKVGLKGPKVIFLVLILVLAGIGTGYGLSWVTQGSGSTGKISQEVASEDIKKGVIVGVTDEKTFRDSAEGDLKKGGIDDEGSHHLERPGGPSQNVYLTSSIVDLDKFVGRKVKVWGETFAAQKAGWLMDVGKLEVLN